jgi:hypothetical protein
MRIQMPKIQDKLAHAGKSEKQGSNTLGEWRAKVENNFWWSKLSGD